MASKESKQPEERKGSFRDRFVRRFKTSPLIFIGTIIVLIIVIIAFVFVPAIVPEAGGAGDLTFGYYNGVPIAYASGSYFDRELQRNLRGGQSNMTVDIYQQIWQYAFFSAVIRQGILDEMKTAGYVTPEDVVDREVALLPDFQVNGKFSVAKYRQMDNSARMNLWRQIRDDIAERHYREDLLGIITSVQEGEFIRSMASPRRTFNLASIPVSAYPDSEIISFIRSSPSLFRVTRLSRITVSSSEREARQILDSIKNEVTTFEDAAKESQDKYAESGGDMGIKMAYEISSEIAVDEAVMDALVNLPRGSLSDIIRIPEGWTFFRAEDDPRPADTGDPALVEKVRTTYVQIFERGRMDDWLLAEADKLAGEIRSKGFDSALYDRNIEKRSFGPLPINYGDVDLYPSVFSFGISELRMAGINDDFWQIAFTTPLLSASKPLIVGDFVLVLYPTEETEADESATVLIEIYYSRQVSQAVANGLGNYFFTNGKLEDRFSEVFRRQILRLN
jgi:hypothetical protein